jgi:peptidoglycan-associated lipoprotein
MIKKSMTGLFIVGFISASLFLTSACQKKVSVDEGPTPEQIAEDEAKKEAERKAEAERKRLEEEQRRAEAERQRLEAERMKAEQEARDAKDAVESEKVYFDYDSSKLKSDSQEILTKKAAWLKANSYYKLKIEGNCDERGSTEYNLALGARRAEAAAKFLNALGIASDRIITVSHGEEKPAVTGHDESAWSRNRRDEFVLIQ